jgi:hypothetical protein
LGLISIRVAGFYVWLATPKHNPPPLPGLGTGYVETTQESLPINIGEVKAYFKCIADLWN